MVSKENYLIQEKEEEMLRKRKARKKSRFGCKSKANKKAWSIHHAFLVLILEYLKAD
jgi:hypothetical protein